MGLIAGGAYNRGGLISGGLITGIKMRSEMCQQKNYFNTSLLTIHTEVVSVEDKFSLY